MAPRFYTDILSQETMDLLSIPAVRDAVAATARDGQRRDVAIGAGFSATVNKAGRVVTVRKVE